MLRWTYLAAGAALLGLVSFAVALSGGQAVTLLWSLAVGVLSLLLVRLIDSNSAKVFGELAPMLTGALAVAFGGLVKWLTTATVGWGDAVAMLGAMAAAWGVEAFSSPGDTRGCFICKQPVDGRTAFRCPRCHQAICAQPSCWIARHFRCRYCDEREVIIFPIDENWWRTRLGPRLSVGACSSCFEEATEADLRECGKCGWPMCKRCWDYNNGRCTHCEWIVPDLPAALMPFLGGGRVARERAQPQRRR